LPDVRRAKFVAMMRSFHVSVEGEIPLADSGIQSDRILPGLAANFKPKIPKPESASQAQLHGETTR